MEVPTLSSSLVATLREYFEGEDPMEDILRFAHSFARDVLVPLAVALAVTGGSIQLLRKVLRHLFPPPDPIRYQEAKAAYRLGLTKDALDEWKKMERHGPSHLSIAAHEIYIQKNPKAALLILDQAKQKFKNDATLIKALEGMQLDAQAMLKGNHVMIQINSAIVKEDYLGVYT